MIAPTGPMAQDTSSSLKIGHMNAQSLCGHFTDIQDLIFKYSFDLLGISETFLKPHVSDHCISIPGYKILRSDRLGKECGGVCIYIRQEFQSRVIDSSPGIVNSCPEFLILEISAPRMLPMLIGVIYRAPRLLLPTAFWESWERSAPTYVNSFCMGDLNINLNNRETPDSRHLLAQVEKIDSCIIPFNPTHHTATSHTWIDHMVVGRQCKLLASSQYPVSMSGHDLLVSVLSFENPRPKARSFEYRDFKNINSSAFLEDLASLSWADFHCSSSIDFKVDFLSKALIDTLNKHAPLKEVTVKKRPAPWLTAEIKSMMGRRDALRQKSRRSGVSDMHSSFKELRNKTKSMVSKSRAVYYKKMLSSCHTSRESWRGVRSLGVGGGKKQAGVKDLAVSLEEIGKFFGRWG